MLNWILMNCVCGMMLGDAELVALFRLRDEADVRLDMRLFARTLWDLKARTGVLSVTNRQTFHAPHRWESVGLIRRI